MEMGQLSRVRFPQGCKAASSDSKNVEIERQIVCTSF